MDWVLFLLLREVWPPEPPSRARAVCRTCVDVVHSYVPNEVDGVFVVLHSHAVHLFLYLVRSPPEFEVVTVVSFTDGEGDDSLSFHIPRVCSCIGRVAAVSPQEPSHEIVVEGGGRVEWCGFERAVQKICT